MRRWSLACVLLLAATPLFAQEFPWDRWLDTRVPEPPPPPEPRRDDRLDLFRQLRLREGDEQRIKALIAQLDAGTYKERQKATTALLAEGPKALALLNQALPGATLEKRTRLENCIKAIDTPGWRADVIQRLDDVRRKPPEYACPALMRCLPCLSGDALDEVIDTLWQLRETDGKLDRLFAEALDDAAPQRRAVAALLVGWYGSDKERESVRRLLEDPDPTVRFRAAHGLLAGRDKHAVPALIAALGKGEYTLADQAEGMLQQVAGDNAPKAALGESAAERAKCHAAWLAWWNQHKDRLDLSGVDVGFGLQTQQKRAEKVATEFLNAIFKTQDFKMLEKTTAVPFYVPDKGLLDTRQAFDAYFDQLKQLPKEMTTMLKFKADGALGVDKAVDLTSRPRDREYLQGLPRGGRLAVKVAMSVEQQPTQDWILIIVRVTGGRAYVIGVCEARGR